jgi:probable rRNA maturation factor
MGDDGDPGPSSRLLQARLGAKTPRLRVDVVAVAKGPMGRGLGTWLAAVAPRKALGRATVAIVSDERLRSLNLQYRGQDFATDVLAFPDGEADYLGDVVIASGVARRQARAEGHPLGIELRVLALHGLLHLIGYNHHTDGGQMARVERLLRRRGGLPAGLIQRNVRRS